MKTTKVEINGKKYTLCLSMRVLSSYENEEGSAVENISKVLNSGRLSGVLDLFQRMIEAGAKYDKICGNESNTLTLEELEAIIEPSDLEKIGTYLRDTLGAKGEIETEDENPKNAEASKVK